MQIIVFRAILCHGTEAIFDSHNVIRYGPTESIV